MYYINMNAKKTKHSFNKVFKEQYQKLRINPTGLLANMGQRIGHGINVNSLMDFAGSHESTEQQRIRKVHEIEDSQNYVTEEQLRHSEKEGNEVRNLLPIFTMSTSGDTLQTSHKSSQDWFHPPRHVDNRLAGTGNDMFTNKNNTSNPNIPNKHGGKKRVVKGQIDKKVRNQKIPLRVQKSSPKPSRPKPRKTRAGRIRTKNGKRFTDFGMKGGKVNVRITGKKKIIKGNVQELPQDYPRN